MKPIKPDIEILVAYVKQRLIDSVPETTSVDAYISMLAETAYYQENFEKAVAQRKEKLIKEYQKKPFKLFPWKITIERT